MKTYWFTITATVGIEAENREDAQEELEARDWASLDYEVDCFEEAPNSPSIAQN